MTLHWKKINVILSLLLLLAGSNCYAILDTSIKGVDGNQYKLSQYIGHGKWVVLNIWGTKCPPCREEMPELVSFHDKHKDNDGIVVGIAVDFPGFGFANQQQVIAFADDYLIDFPLLLSDAGITEKIGLGRLQALPTTYLFNPDGNVTAMQAGAITQKLLEDFINRNSSTETR